jgi:hypothetical protein
MLCLWCWMSVSPNSVDVPSWLSLQAYWPVRLQRGLCAVSVTGPLCGMRPLSPILTLLSSPHNIGSPNRYSATGSPSRISNSSLKKRMPPSVGVQLKFPATTSRERLLRNHWDLIAYGGGKESLPKTSRPGFVSSVRPDLSWPTHGIKEEECTNHSGAKKVLIFSFYSFITPTFMNRFYL